MSCSQYGELISAYIDDELSKKEVRLLLHHLEECSACEEELSKYLFQREKIVSLRSAYFAPIPHPEFPQTVMANVYKEQQLSPAAGKFHWALSEFSHWLLSPLQRPAFAMSFSLLLFLGLLASLYLNVFPSHDTKKEQLLSVYELSTNKTPAQAVKVAARESEEDSTVFHHIAYSSAETFAAEPSLLEYAAYSPVSK